MDNGQITVFVVFINTNVKELPFYNSVVRPIVRDTYKTAKKLISLTQVCGYNTQFLSYPRQLS